jgi:two-component system response regulator GlrR
MALRPLFIESSPPLQEPAANPLPSFSPQTGRFGPLVGASPAMRALYARLARLPLHDATVLIRGATGTGKELVARTVHDTSLRAAGPFVVLDCGSLPEALLDAELFGHSRGAFTGAITPRPGAFEAAHGGTLFLDEVGELPAALQPRLLRVLESRTVRRLGENHTRPIDVRFVAATHRDLGAMVRAGAFREDLYFRLAVLTLTVPPLRERPSDIPALLEHFLPPSAHALLTPAVVAAAISRAWPGNVRELRNFAERLLALGPEEALAAASMSGAGEAIPLDPELLDLPFREARQRAVAQVEKAYLAAQLGRHGGNVTAAAAAAGLNRTYLHRLLNKHRLSR